MVFLLALCQIDIWGSLLCFRRTCERLRELS